MTTKAQSLYGYPVDQIASSRVVANNTFEIMGPLGDKTIRLHFTDIAIFRPDGSIMLDSGGWQTITTRERMNRFLPKGLAVYQERSRWFVEGWGGGDYVPRKTLWKVPYFDGIVIPADRSKPKVPYEKRLVAKQDKILKQIDRYVKKVNKLIADKKLPLPNGGDCWICMFGESNVDMRSPGTIRLSNEHIASHLSSCYVHGALIVNALKWAGYNPQYTYGFWNTGRVVRRYLKFRMGMPY